MKKSRLLGAVCAMIFSLISMSPHAALVNNGFGLIYDTVLDITWAQPEPWPDGWRTWNDATTWAAGLGSGWRLPYISVAAGAGPVIDGVVDCNTATEVACRDNELGYMFYHNLSGTYGSPILTSGDPDLALFPTLRSAGYWSGTEFDSNSAWLFGFSVGVQTDSLKDYVTKYSWAVHAGNVVIPVPAAVWLFGSGLIGLLGVAKRRC